jgi:hypothetical protein
MWINTLALCLNLPSRVDKSEHGSHSRVISDWLKPLSCPRVLQRNNHALCIFQLHSTGTTNQGTTDANGSVDAGKIVQFVQIGSACFQSINGGSSGKAQA